MYTIKSFLALVICSIALFGCSYEEKSKQTTSPEENEQNTPPQQSKIIPSTVEGVVRGYKFQIEQARLENGTLTLRQGKDFFANRSISIVTFEKDSLENKTIKVNSESGFGSPHLRLGIKKKDDKLPDEKIVLNDYEMELTFGKQTELGIPFSIRLIVNEDTRTDVKGSYFATFGDIRIKDNQIDLSYDSFDTLIYVSRQYLQNKYPNAHLLKQFGTSYSGNSKENYPKVGFIGYEIITEDSIPSTVKMQLYKNENGWSVARQLTEKQIHLAHPIEEAPLTGTQRTIKAHLAKVAAALKLEDDLNKQGLISKVRATTANCYLTKNLDMASCRLVYGISESDEVVCMNKSYLLQSAGDNWTVEKEISETERVDYNSGELVSYKPFNRSCN